ncbi:MAG: energy transducer TonB [Gammaproteobacteria bacterium]|nr:energy transducer TonB [Gammaproteobacteria bacterium]
MTATAHQPITANDRLGMTLFLAVSFHALLILGLSFNIQDDLNTEAPPLPTMEIILVHSQDPDNNDDAQYLAQSNQRGGGESTEPVRPGSPLNNPLPIPQQGEYLQSQMETAPRSDSQPNRQPVMSVEQRSSWSVEQQQRLKSPLQRKLEEDLLRQRQLELASISAEIRQLQETYAQSPREKYISANTREYKYASYFDAWRAKVERIGNLNYPDAAKQGRLSGTLLLDVTVHPDGRVGSITVLRSSGHTILDDAAKRIVQMATPFAPFSAELREDFDLMHITYTWRFDSKTGVQTGH